MTVTVKKSGQRIELDVARMLDWLVAQAVGIIQRRSAKGQGLDGPFPPYSASYQEALREGGESTRVDLTVTGGYLASISERSRTVDQASGRAVATIGPGTGTSEQRHFSEGRAKHTGRRSPPHNVLARLLARRYPHLGLTKDEAKRLAAQAMKVALRQQGR